MINKIKKGIAAGLVPLVISSCGVPVQDSLNNSDSNVVVSNNRNYDPILDGVLETQAGSIYIPFLYEGGLGLGRYKLGMEDDISLVLSGKFDYYKNHKGGTDDTLEIISKDGSVYMRWAYDSLMEIDVREGWGGHTERGLKIGDSFERFKELYPKAIHKDSDSFYKEIYKDSFIQDNIWVKGHLKVDFDDEDKVDFIGVEVIDYDKEDRVFPIGPIEWYIRE